MVLAKMDNLVGAGLPGAVLCAGLGAGLSALVKERLGNLLWQSKVIRETHDYSKKRLSGQTLAPQTGLADGD